MQIDFDYEDVWKFKSWHELENLLMWGTYSYYGGGGYVADFGKTEKAAQQTAKYLRHSTWVDQYTRAVFLEFAVYNPPTNLFGVSYMLVEFPPTGGNFSGVTRGLEMGELMWGARVKWGARRSVEGRKSAK